MSDYDFINNITDIRQPEKATYVFAHSIFSEVVTPNIYPIIDIYINELELNLTVIFALKITIFNLVFPTWVTYGMSHE